MAIKRPHEFITLCDIEKQDADGKITVIKRDIESRLTIDLEGIDSVREYITTRGKVSKNKCYIKIPEGTICIKAKYAHVKELVFGRQAVKINGFLTTKRR